MSAEQITPERIAKLAAKRGYLNPDEADELLDALESSRAEVQRLTEQNVSMEAEIRILTEEARRSDAGRVEVPELTDAILDLACGPDLSGKADLHSAAFRDLSRMQYRRGWEDLASRLSPSPQPAIQIAHIGDSVRDSLQPDGSVLTERWTRGELVERVVSQPSADVVVPRSAAEFAVWAFDLVECPDPEHYEAVRAFHDALRSSTNHDAQDAAQPTTNDETRG